MTRVLVTGASGYIGRTAVSALRKYGAEVIALVRDHDAGISADSVIRGDVLDSSGRTLSAVVAAEPVACVHLAWRDGFNHSSQSHMEDLSGHYRFLLGLIQAGVPRICAMGSVHEVGYWEGPVDEETPCQPASLYGIAKDSLRRAFLLSAERAGVEGLWMRGYYVYGNDELSPSVFGKMARAAARGERHFPFVTGRALRDFIHVDELGRQIAACALAVGETGVVNCCTGLPESMASRAESFLAENGYDMTLDYGVYPDRPYDSPGIWGDASKISAIMARMEAEHGIA